MKDVVVKERTFKALRPGEPARPTERGGVRPSRPGQHAQRELGLLGDSVTRLDLEGLVCLAGSHLTVARRTSKMPSASSMVKMELRTFRQASWRSDAQEQLNPDRKPRSMAPARHDRPLAASGGPLRRLKSPILPPLGPLGRRPGSLEGQSDSSSLVLGALPPSPGVAPHALCVAHRTRQRQQIGPSSLG